MERVEEENGTRIVYRNTDMIEGIKMKALNDSKQHHCNENFVQQSLIICYHTRRS
jgi:hypothetical protein